MADAVCAIAVCCRATVRRLSPSPHFNASAGCGNLSTALRHQLLLLFTAVIAAPLLLLSFAAAAVLPPLPTAVAVRRSVPFRSESQLPRRC